MTIMIQGDSSGRVRRCDANCHKATSKHCDCICGGRYHGKGDQAQELLTRDWLGANWRERKAEIEAAGGSFEVAVRAAFARAAERPNQFDLFGGAGGSR